MTVGATCGILVRMRAATLWILVLVSAGGISRADSGETRASTTDAERMRSTSVTISTP